MKGVAALFVSATTPLIALLLALPNFAMAELAEGLVSSAPVENEYGEEEQSLGDDADDMATPADSDADVPEEVTEDMPEDDADDADDARGDAASDAPEDGRGRRFRATACRRAFGRSRGAIRRGPARGGRTRGGRNRRGTDRGRDCSGRGDARCPDLR